MQNKSEYISASPPLHAILFLSSISCICLLLFPSMESIDEVATIDLFTKRRFPFLIPNIEVLGWVRIGFSVIVAFVATWMFYGKGRVQITQYKKHSKLRSNPIHLHRFGTLAPYTSWVWILLGFSFFLNGLIPLMVAYGYQNQLLSHHRWILRMALLTFEAAVPNTFLVGAVIKYFIWPLILQSGYPTDELQHWTALMQHNSNVYMCLLELTLLGDLSIHWSHVALAPMFGIVYIVFTWICADIWTKQRGDPQFLYDFFDTTLGNGEETIAIIVLLLVNLICFGFFSIFTTFLEQQEQESSDDYGPLMKNVFFAIVSSLLVCRWRD